MRASGFHQSGPGSFPGVDANCRLRFVVGSRPCSEGFSPGTTVFLPSTKTNILKFQFDLETVDKRATLWKTLKFPFIYFIIYLLFIYCHRGLSNLMLLKRYIAKMTSSH